MRAEGTRVIDVSPCANWFAASPADMALALNDPDVLALMGCPSSL